jgi:peroxiredoxin Q/BCP
MIDVGADAPEFTLPNQHGEDVSLSSFHDTYVVVYFYPEALTSGCTIEARGFREQWPEYESLGVPVLGISLDPVSDLEEFATEEDLPFTLLSDAEGDVARAYGVYDEGVYEGTSYELASRVTYLIAPDGTVARRYDDVNPDDHAETVLADLQALLESAE